MLAFFFSVTGPESDPCADSEHACERAAGSSERWRSRWTTCIPGRWSRRRRTTVTRNGPHWLTTTRSPDTQRTHTWEHHTGAGDASIGRCEHRRADRHTTPTDEPAARDDDGAAASVRERGVRRVCAWGCGRGSGRVLCDAAVWAGVADGVECGSRAACDLECARGGRGPWRCERRGLSWAGDGGEAEEHVLADPHVSMRLSPSSMPQLPPSSRPRRIHCCCRHRLLCVMSSPHKLPLVCHVLIFSLHRKGFWVFFSIFAYPLLFFPHSVYSHSDTSAY